MLACLLCGEPIINMDYTELECVNAHHNKAQRIGQIGYMHDSCKKELEAT